MSCVSARTPATLPPSTFSARASQPVNMSIPALRAPISNARSRRRFSMFAHDVTMPSVTGAVISGWRARTSAALMNSHPRLAPSSCDCKARMLASSSAVKARWRAGWTNSFDVDYRSHRRSIGAKAQQHLAAFYPQCKVGIAFVGIGSTH